MMLFGWLLRLFPRTFRERFGDDMREMFADQLRAARAVGRGAVVRVWSRAILGMMMAAWREHRVPAPIRLRLPVGEPLMFDLRLAVRAMVRAPFFTIVVVAALSLGVGAVTTIFSALNALVLRPLPAAADGGVSS